MSTRPVVLDHLVTMTDDVGVFQHARYDVPNRAHGYCTDDVSRALIVACEAARVRTTEAVGAKLVATYLAYLLDAQLPDGSLHNFMGYDRRWQDVRGTDDAIGRAIWGLGTASVRAPRESWRRVADGLAHAAIPQVEGFSHLRSRAYAALGIAAMANVQPADRRLTGALRAAVAPLAAAFKAHADPAWLWCESTMTYDNARLPEALMRAGSLLSDDGLVAIGVQMLGFLSSIVLPDDIFVPIGNDGWYPRGGVRAQYGQQPLEAASMIDASLLAYSLTGDVRWMSVAQTAYDWYFGRNLAGATMAVRGGCRDGIDTHGASANMGAESTIAYLLATLSIANTGVLPLRIAR